MRDHDRETQKDGAEGHPPQKSKAGGEQDLARQHADGHAAARPEILRDERMAHPANAEPRADLLRHLQHSHGNAYVQRVVGEAGAEKMHEPGAAAESHAHGVAQPLDAGVRSGMESAFGEDLGDVRVHTGKGAGEAAEHLGARAFTRGRDVYFNEGEYNPSTREGKELLAHELAHVLQQRGGAPDTQSNRVGTAGDAFEREAHEAAAAVLGGGQHQVMSRADAPAIQREEKKPQQASAPTIKSHSKGITPDTGSGAINADGQFSVSYTYTIVDKATSVPLTLAVPEGVAVNVTPITSIPAGEYTVQNAGGTTARAVIVTATNGLKNPPAFQVAFTKGTFTYIVVFHFPGGEPSKKPDRTLDIHNR
ncbi:MAG: DUF4157 domain-containing protein [Pyrinomonadaceae bacterium]